MFCNKCGQTLPEGSRFCNSCGAQTVAPASKPDVPASDRSLDDEHEIFALRPTMLFVVVRYLVAALIVIVAAGLTGIVTSRFPGMSGLVAFFVMLGVAIAAFANPVYNHVLRRREVYTLTNHKLEMRHGIIAKVVRNIPLSKLQDVTVMASFWQRLLKLGDIEIDSASETGKEVWHNIHQPDHYANIILAELRKRN